MHESGMVTEATAPAPHRMRPTPGKVAAVARVRISIIIPTRNEAGSIGATIDRAKEGPVDEIIVVDGASHDDTVAIARQAGAAVLESPPGRGGQLRLGAEAASGDILIFLHADTLLPCGFAEHVRSVVGREDVAAGAFRLRIDSHHRSFRLIERFVSWRSHMLRLPYGDQAMFMRREMYRRAGGFADIPAMEDFNFARRLRRIGRIVIGPPAVETSARGWLERGVWRTTLLNQKCIAGYLLGVSPKRIARWRAL